jgi:hypothetical protein
VDRTLSSFDTNGPLQIYIAHARWERDDQVVRQGAQEEVCGLAGTSWHTCPYNAIPHGAGAAGRGAGRRRGAAVLRRMSQLRKLRHMLLRPDHRMVHMVFAIVASGQDWINVVQTGTIVCTTCGRGKYVTPFVGICTDMPIGSSWPGMLFNDESINTAAKCVGDCDPAAPGVCPSWHLASPPWASSTTDSALCASCPAGKYQDLNNVMAANNGWADHEACMADESSPACQSPAASSVCKDCPAGKTSPVASESEGACGDVIVLGDKGSGGVERAATSIGLFASMMALTRTLA